jgi:hypothetical protein
VLLILPMLLGVFNQREPAQCGGWESFEQHGLRYAPPRSFDSALQALRDDKSVMRSAQDDAFVGILAKAQAARNRGRNN